MKPKNYEVLMDIYMGVLNAPAIQFTTEDFGMCQITFSLLEDRITPYNLSNCIVRMVINGQQQDCTISDANNGKAEIVLLQSMFTEVGHVFAELQIYDATNQTMRLTTPTFKYTVRKSLMDDNTVQADANYSILQQMILNVSNADKVSSEALKLSKEAKAICDDLVPKANTAAQNAQTALDRAESVVTQEELAQKVTLDGNDTKFDFIENKVGQDGLKHLSKISPSTVKTGINIQNSTDDFDIMIIIDQLTRITSTVNSIVMMQDTNSAKMDMRFQLTGGNYRVGVWISGINNIPVLQQVERPRYIGFKRKNGVYYSYTDTQVLELGKTTESISFIGAVFGNSRSENEGFIVPIAYNRELSQEEKQHNLSTFNNPTSIRELHTTDSADKTSILKLGSDEDHVEMASGRTLREEYMGVLKTMGKEFTSADGSPVEVNNGIEARLINGEIKGKTVKSQAYNWKNTIIDYTTKQLGLWHSINNNVPCVIILKVAEIKNNPNLEVQVTYNTSLTAYPKTVLTNDGYYKIDLSTYGTNIRIDYIRMVSPLENQSLKLVEYTIINKSDADYVSQTFNGLNSTQAIIKNNGQQYPIYASEEDKANKKVILLGGVGGVYNTLEIKDDGGVVYTQNIKEIVLDNNINCTLTNSYSSENHLFFNISAQDIKMVSDYRVQGIICDRFKWEEFASFASKDYEFICGNNVNAKVGIKIAKAKLESPTVEGFKKWLQNNPVTVQYQLETPIITHIPKELVPTILTQQTNILEVGGAVKPSSFKVTVPVDRLAEIEARLQALESTTVDVVLNK